MITSGDIKSEYKYGVQVKGGSYSVGNWVSYLYGNGHFSFGASGVEKAHLFDTATDAEAQTKAGRDASPTYKFVVVPVKVTTTTETRTETKTVRSIA